MLCEQDIVKQRVGPKSGSSWGLDLELQCTQQVYREDGWPDNF